MKRLPVYLAASSAEIPRVKAVASRLEAAGCRMTHRWWLDIDAYASQGLADQDLDLRDRLRARFKDEDAIMACHAFLCLSGRASGGRMYELGFARALRRLGDRPDIVIVGDGGHPIFGPAAEHEHAYESDEQAIAYLAQRAQRRWG